MDSAIGNAELLDLLFSIKHDAEASQALYAAAHGWPYDLPTAGPPSREGVREVGVAVQRGEDRRRDKFQRPNTGVSPAAPSRHFTWDLPARA
ncbi:hypothetical protein OHO83_41670 [Streptomyces sp. NBC_00569]|uniref:hypothetical protein n=1 Tax=unclassified Streptomyces TaxID=2593676 RepID=UPI0022522342|nr:MULTISPECIES: hypothetical protein [unclassified Streptomyces]MCX5434897.1 hypothetical protein [Streptomyces sp. NBC_00063]WUB98305.1 hypothetical protein OHO83_41670 [Streptomyces sp. NBC_00569]